MLSIHITLLAVGLFLLDVSYCATTSYTVHIGTQATITGFEYDAPPGRAFYGIPYAQPLTNRNRFMVRLSLRNYCKIKVKTVDQRTHRIKVFQNSKELFDC
jgi:hypothetical protein